jgi:hypothetical protein
MFEILFSNSSDYDEDNENSIWRKYEEVLEILKLAKIGGDVIGDKHYGDINDDMWSSSSVEQ